MENREIIVFATAKCLLGVPETSKSPDSSAVYNPSLPLLIKGAKHMHWGANDRMVPFTDVPACVPPRAVLASEAVQPAARKGSAHVPAPLCLLLATSVNSSL